LAFWLDCDFSDDFGLESPASMRNRFRFSLRTKIIAWLFIPTAVIWLLVAFTLYAAYQGVTEEYAIDRDVELTRLSATEISSGFEEFVDRLWTLSRYQVFQQGDSNEKRLALENYRNRLIYFDAGVYVLDNLGVLVTSLPEQPDWIGEDWSDRSYFRRVFRSTQSFFSDIESHGPGGSDVIVIAVPILGENEEFRGVLLGMFRLDAYEVSPFFGTILKLRVGQSGNAMIVDGKGRLVFDSDFKRIGDGFENHPAFNGVQQRKVGAERTRSLDRRDVVVSYAPVPRTQWSLVVEENWNDLVQPTREYRNFLLALLAAGIVLPTIVALVGVRRITGPVNDFIVAANEIAGGNFNQEVRVKSKDELQELAEQFNRMAAELKASYANLEDRVHVRTKELTALNDIAEIVSSSLDLNEILPDALAKIIDLMGMDAGAIVGLDEEAKHLKLLAHQGLDKNFLKLMSAIQVNASVMSAVIETTDPNIRQVDSFAPGPFKNALQMNNARMLISIPIISQEKNLGTINVFTRKSTEPSPEGMAVASSIGQYVGVAMENSRLYLQTVNYAQDMEVARQRAEAANQAKSAFLANMSHELRTPLNAIVGFTRIVKRKGEGILPAKQIDNLDKVLISADHLLGLINSILDIAKIEAGRMDVVVSTFNIKTVVDIAVSTTQPLLRQSVHLISEIDPEVPLMHTDQEKLKQILLNLLSNAVKFTREGKIIVSVKKEGQIVCIEVADTGIGIRKEDLGRIFKEFQQADTSSTREYTGTGLGLSISRSLARLLGGDIRAKSQFGEGSTFIATIPAQYDGGNGSTPLS
jgi:signal transduction histidine kinase